MHSASVGQPCVNERHCIIEAPPNGSCQALGEPAYIPFAWKSEISQLEPSTAIDEDLVRAVDQHVGHPRLVEQRLQWTSADTVSSQRIHSVEYG
jgi:hypothetical protein